MDFCRAELVGLLGLLEYQQKLQHYIKQKLHINMIGYKNVLDRPWYLTFVKCSIFLLCCDLLTVDQLKHKVIKWDKYIYLTHLFTCYW